VQSSSCYSSEYAWRSPQLFKRTRIVLTWSFRARLFWSFNAHRWSILEDENGCLCLYTSCVLKFWLNRWQSKSCSHYCYPSGLLAWGSAISVSSDQAVSEDWVSNKESRTWGRNFGLSFFISEVSHRSTLIMWYRLDFKFQFIRHLGPIKASSLPRYIDTVP